MAEAEYRVRLRPQPVDTEIPDHLLSHVRGVQRLVQELHENQQRNTRLREEISQMRRQLDERKSPPAVAKLEKEIERLRSGLEQSKHRGRTEVEQWKRYAESLEALLAGDPQRPVPRPEAA